MIAKLTGNITDVGLTHITVEVGGVGFLVSIVQAGAYKVGEAASLHTYLAVRENALDLYGFSTANELSMFHELIKIPKIGPKTALGILSQVDLKTLRRAVSTNDPTYLTKMSGIGKKSAEKIVLGLKDLLNEEDLAESRSEINEIDSDVVDALITLGYSQKDSLEALQSIPKDVEGTNARIKYALKQLSR